MLFNSIEFMAFLPIVLLVYFFVPKRIRYVWLLIISYYFYMGWNPTYALLIAFSTVATYAGGLAIEHVKIKNPDAKVLKVILAGTIGCNLLILGFFKYFEFAVQSLISVLNLFGADIGMRRFDILLPVGISFYTFQALSYVIDVYRGEIRAEKNILKYALFVSFFPQLVAGPIERSKNLLSQVQNIHTVQLWNMDRVVRGAIYMVWGFFMKMVIADRAAILVNTVFDSYYMYGTLELVTAAIWFAIQIYCDFGGYSMIAIGVAKVMGFDLMENFDAPYFAMSIKEFWRRWHISLSTWFKDYVYIPLGGNRGSQVKKYRNLVLTFVISGLWHGAAWTFVIWGALHGVFQVVGDLTTPVRKKISEKLQINTNCFSHRALKRVVTFALVAGALVVFRADNVHIAFDYFVRMLTEWNPWAFFDGTLYAIGLNMTESKVLLFAALLLFLVDWIKYEKKETIDSILLKQNLWFSWGCVIALIMMIVVYGVYGPSYDATQFIYFQF